MKVNISVFGRFHAFDLAKECNKAGVLNKIITTYPKFKVNEWGISNDKIISKIIFELLNRASNKFKSNWFNSFIKSLFAKQVSQQLNECDIFIGWSGASLETLIEAKKRGVITVLERGSSHYSYQQNILSSEYKLQGLEFRENYQSWQRELLEYELADYISIPSSFVKRSFIEYGIPEEKLLINPYGVDLSSFRQIKKEDDTFRIIFAGGGNIRKGYHYLLQAFYELNLPNCELWHLGTINDEIKPFLDRYQTENWILKGHQSQNMLYKFYSQGNVFVMPSLEEGLSMVQLQAMACGLPLICSTNTGGDDLITKDGEEGFVIPIRDVEALKEKILYMYNNQEICKEMGQKAKAKVSRGFTWNDYGNRYIKNLREIYENKNK